MSKVIIIAGYGPGISRAVAETFGREGFAVALVGRTAEKLAAGVKALETKGIRAGAFPANLGDPGSTREVVRKVRAELGSIDAIEWTAYDGGAGDLMKADPAAVQGVLGVATSSLLAAVQEAHADLKQNKGAVLVTNGALGDAMNELAVAYQIMGLALANAAKKKLVALLGIKLAPDGIFVGEVVVAGIVKGTAFDRGGATIDPETVAARFLEMYRLRDRTSVQIP